MEKKSVSTAAMASTIVLEYHHFAIRSVKYSESSILWVIHVVEIIYVETMYQIVDGS